MFRLFGKKKPLLDDDITEWIFDCFEWALQSFDSDSFINETVLVLPDNQHFPGSESSAEGMARLILSQVKEFAGLKHWPTQLFDMTQPTASMPLSAPVNLNGSERGEKAQASSSGAVPVASPVPRSIISQLPLASSHTLTESTPLALTYHPQQLRSPEGLIAYFAQMLAQQLARTAKQPPPGGDNYLPMAGELTGVFLGFGIMFANSAVVPRQGGCGGCGGAQSPVREVYLSEEESTYALALFCHYKQIEAKKVTKHLKKHLRGFFKSALKDCKARKAEPALLDPLPTT